MQDLYADVIVDISHEKLDKVFQYKIPDSLKERIKRGSVVEIPFGNGNRITKGYIIDITDKASYDPAKMKELYNVVTRDKTQETKLIELAAWMKENYGSTMIQALKVVLPFKKDIRTKQDRYITLRLPIKDAEVKLQEFTHKNQKARERFLRILIEKNSFSYQHALHEYKITSSTIQYFSGQGIIAVHEQAAYRNPVKVNEETGKEIYLNKEQEEVITTILQNYGQNRHYTYLLHGITGSGKTEVYMEVISEVVKQGRQAIVLIPEIALTYQTVNRFYRKFGDRVSIVNSKMSQGEKYDQFERAKNKEIDVIIGPRSALFTPFSNLGIIIIDEEHESSYKSEQMPRYHAREVAIELARLNKASVILGSATPSVNSYYHALKNEYKLLSLPSRATNSNLPNVSVVDLREELKNGNRSIFSDALRLLINDRLKRKEQIMLFLNRRGYSGFVSCRSCGHVMKCPHCDVSLCIHNNGKLVCHYCGYETNTVNLCPKCHSKAISGFKAGTQQVEELLKREFQGAGILRMDMDSTRNKNGYTDILSAFSRHEADILIGTQMIVKGHDFPYVTLVGILAADLSLYADDYRACERTFQLLTQAAGRAGRGALPGEVIIQTYSPDNYSVQAAAKQDYLEFYQQEIQYRTLAGYPPVANLLCILLTSRMEDKVDECSIKAVNVIKAQKIENLQVIGPSNAYIAKVKDTFRKIIYIKHADNEKLIQIKDRLESYLNGNEDFLAVYVQFDFDPVSAV